MRRHHIGWAKERSSVAAILTGALFCFACGSYSATPESIEMALIPGGTFTTGASEDQREKLAKDYEVHPSLFQNQSVQEITLPSFYIDKYEVTCKEYRRFVEATGHRLPVDWFENGYSTAFDDLPITGIDYQDAAAFASWAGKRLPTEYEWELAARGTDGRLWPWGDEWKSGACCMDDAGAAPMPLLPDPVGSHPEDRSPYGAMDMAGSVSEWVDSALQPQFTSDCAGMRGGSFVNSEPFQFIGANRNAQPKNNGGIGYIGFRCALDGTKDPKALPNRSTGKKVVEVPETDREAPIATPPDPSQFGKESIRIFQVPDLDPTREKYQNTMVCCHMPHRDGKSAQASVPWKLELRAPYLPGDRIAIFFENYWGRPMGEIEFSEDHTKAAIRANFPGSVDVKIDVAGGLDYVDVDYDVTNLSDRFMPSTVEMCMSLLAAPSFRDHDGDRTYMLTDQGFKKRNQVFNAPFDRLWCQDFTIDEISRTSVIAPLMQRDLIATLSRDGDWVIAPTSVSGRAIRLFNNWEYSCLHAIPYSAAYPGERVQVKQRLYFLRGGLGALASRHEKDQRIAASIEASKTAATKGS